MEKISIVVPCYNEEESITLFYEEFNKVAKIMQEQKFELIFVDDGSKDKTLDLAKSIAKTDDRVFYISFSRNFGKEAAILAGLKASTGDYVALMDADLQDPPSLLPQMFKAIKEENYDSVATRRFTRKGEPKIRSFFAKAFYKVMSKISDTDMINGARDYRLMKRRMVDAVLSMTEKNRFTKGIFGWVGFKTKWIKYENVERVAGHTKWSFWKLAKYAIDGLTDFSLFPLRISTFLGVFNYLLALVSLILGIVFACKSTNILTTYFIFILFGLFVMFGTIMLLMGILSRYVSKIVIETKDRPVYIISETNKD